MFPLFAWIPLCLPRPIRDLPARGRHVAPAGIFVAGRSISQLSYPTPTTTHHLHHHLCLADMVYTSGCDFIHSDILCGAPNGTVHHSSVTPTVSWRVVQAIHLDEKCVFEHVWE